MKRPKRRLVGAKLRREVRKWTVVEEYKSPPSPTDWDRLALVLSQMIESFRKRASVARKKAMASTGAQRERLMRDLAYYEENIRRMNPHGPKP